MLSIRIIEATEEHIPLIASSVMSAIGIYDFEENMNHMQTSIFKALLDICASEDTLYSFRHSRILICGDRLAGCLISYDGAIYPKARNRSFTAFRVLDDNIDQKLWGQAETGPGEYYLDSLAIIPEFRGRGLGKLLISDAVGIGKSLGFKKATLIADKAHSTLISYYRSAGFQDGEEILFFAEPYLRMFMDL